MLVVTPAVTSERAKKPPDAEDGAEDEVELDDEPHR